MAMNTFDTEVMVRRLLESDNVDDVLAQVQERHDEELARVSGGAAGGASRSTALSTAAAVRPPGSRSLSRDQQHNNHGVVDNSVENPLSVFTSGVVTTTSLHRVSVERRGNSATSVHEHHTVNMSELTRSQRANSFAADVQQDRRSMSLISPALENESEASTGTQKRRIMAPANINDDDDDDGAFPDFHRPAGNHNSGKDRFTPPLPPSARHLSPTMFAEGNDKNNGEQFPHHPHRSLPPSTLASEADEGEVIRPASANGDGHRERSGSYPILPSSSGLGSFGSSGMMQRYLDNGSLRSHSSPPAHHHDDVLPPRGYVGPQKSKKKTIPPPANTPSPGKKIINHTADYKRAATALSPTSKLNISSRAQLSRQALRRNYAELVAARSPPPPDPSFLAYHDGPSLLLRHTLACDEGDVSATSIIPTGRGGAAGTVSPPRRVAANGTRYVPDPFLLHAPFGYQAPLEDDLEGFDGSGTSPGQRSGSHQEGNTKRSRRGSATLAKVPSNISVTAVPTVLSSHALKLLASPKASGTPVVSAPSGVPDVDESSSAVGGIYEVGTNQQRSFEVGEGEPLTDDEDHQRFGAGGNVVPVVGTSRDNNRRVIEHQQHVQSRNPRAAKTTAMSKFRNSLLVVSAPRHPHQQQSGTSQSLIGGGIAGSGLSSPDSQHIVPLGPGGVVVHGRTDTLDSMGINHVVDYFEHSGSHVVSAMDELSTLKPLAANPSNNSIKSSVNQRNGGRKGSVGGKSSGSNNKPPSSTGSSAAAAAHAPPAAVLAGKKQQQQERAAEWMSPASPLGRDDDFAVPPRSSPRGQSEGGPHSDHDNDDDYTYDYSYTYSSYYTASDRDGDSDGSGSYGTTSSDAPPPRRVATCDAPVPNPRTSVAKPSAATPPAKVGAKKSSAAKNGTVKNAPSQPASPQRLTNSSFNGPTQGPSPADWILRGKGSFALGAPATNALMRFNAALEGVGRPVSSVASVSSAQEVTPAMNNNNNSQQPRRALNARRDGNIYREPSMRTATRFQRMRTPLTATTKTSTATPHSGSGGGPLGRSFTSALNHNGSMARRPPMTPTSATYRNGPTTEFLPFASETSGAVHPSSPAFGGMQPHQQQFQQQLPPRTPRFAHPQQQQSLLLHQSVQFPQQLSSGNTSRSASAAFMSSTAVVAHATLPTAHQHTQPPASQVTVQAPTNPRQIVWESKGHVEVPPASQQHDISSSTGVQQDRFHVPLPQDPSSAAPISSTSSSRFAPPATAPVVYRSGSRGTTASKATGREQHYTEDAQRGDTVAQHGSGDNLSSPNGGNSRRLNSQDNNALPGRSVSTMAIGIPHSRSASSGAAAQQQPYHQVPVARVSAEYQGRSASFYDPNRSASASSIQQRFGIQVK